MRLIPIENGQQLDAEAGRQYIAFINDLDQRLGRHIPLTEGFRSPERQKHLYDSWRAGVPGYNPAYSPADPRANHLRGRCVDIGGGVGITSSVAHQTARAIAPAYGYSFNVPGEGWHAEYVGGATLIAPEGITFSFGRPAPAPAPATPQESEEDTMRFTLIAGRLTGWKAPYILDAEDGKRRALSAQELAIYRNRPFGKLPEVGDQDQAAFDLIPKKEGSK